MKWKALLVLNVFCLLMLGSCKTQFVLTEARRQPFAGGAAGSGSGNNYSVIFQKDAGRGGKILDVWMGDRSTGKLFKFNLQVDDKTSVIATGEIPSEARKVIVNFSERFAGEGRPGQEHAPQYLAYPETVEAPEWLPAHFQKGCIIRYENAKGKTGFIEADSFQVMPRLALP